MLSPHPTSKAAIDALLYENPKTGLLNYRREMAQGTREFFSSSQDSEEVGSVWKHT